MSHDALVPEKGPMLLPLAAGLLCLAVSVGRRAAGDDYALGLGDGISIAVLNNPELERQQRVAHRGRSGSTLSATAPPPVEQFAIGAGCSSSQPSYSLPTNSSEKPYFAKIFIYTAFCNLIEK